MIQPEEHNTILCERLHLSLNKTQFLHETDLLTYEKWISGILFAIYYWKA